jgi:glycosyltransferase involved in cell wall biosynthesis
LTKISIVIPCYNAEAFIGDAIASALAQSHADVECIVVDDRSTDGSVAIIARAAAGDPRVKPVFLPENLGASGARNAGLAVASGDWITLLDADDLYRPTRLERLLATALAADAAMVVDNQQVCAFPATTSTQLAFGFIHEDPTQVTPELYFAEAAKFGRWLSPGYMKPMFRADLVRALNLRFDPRFKTGEDFLLYADALVDRPRFVACAFAGYVYRRREGSLSRAGGEHLRAQARLSDVILERHGDKLSAQATASLRARKQLMSRLAGLHDVRVAISDRDFGGALKAVTLQPDLAMAAVGMLKRKIANALAPAADVKRAA